MSISGLAGFTKRSMDVSILQNSTATACKIQANADIYGIGIRLGIYFQWLTSTLMWLFDLDGIDELIPVAIMFSASLFTAVMVLVANKSAYVIEIVIVGWLTFGFSTMASIPTELSRYAVKHHHQHHQHREEPAAVINGPRKHHLGPWKSYLGSFVSFMWICFNFWFYLLGYKSDRFMSHPCGAVTFLFAKIQPEHFYQYALFMVAGCGLFIGVLALFVLGFILVLAWAFLWLRITPSALIEHWDMASEGSTEEDQVAELESELEPQVKKVSSWVRLVSPRTFRYLTAALLVAIYIFSLLAIELNIRWNNIQNASDLGTTGQLIPFMIGSMGLVRVCNRIYQEFREKRNGARLDLMDQPVRVTEEKEKEIDDAEASAPNGNASKSAANVTQRNQPVNIKEGGPNASNIRTRVSKLRPEADIQSSLARSSYQECL